MFIKIFFYVRDDKTVELSIKIYYGGGLHNDI